MTPNDIETWLVNNNFERDEDELFKCNHGDAEISVSIQPTNVMVCAEDSHQVIKITSCHPSKATIDEFGMIHGIGLTTPFLNSFNQGMPPKWWPEEYLQEQEKAFRSPSH